MQAFHVKTTLNQNGKLLIKGLPYQKGDIVEVIIFPEKHIYMGERYPLRGKPIIYDHPFDSVAEDEWDALK